MLAINMDFTIQNFRIEALTLLNKILMINKASAIDIIKLSLRLKLLTVHGTWDPSSWSPIF